MIANRKANAVDTLLTLLALAGGFLPCLAAETVPFTQSAVIYVDQNATGSLEDGLTWCTAYRSLSNALLAVDNVMPAAIRIANGIYTPDAFGAVDPRDATFEIAGGITLMGGYAGCESVLPNRRDPKVFPTILSGDLAGDDDPEADACGGSDCCVSHHGQGCSHSQCSSLVVAERERCLYDWDELCVELANSVCCELLNARNKCENAYNVIRAVSSTQPPFTIDGIIIEGGHANSNSRYHGSALLAYQSHVLRNCGLRNNYASFGGALYTRAASTIMGSEFRNNEAAEQGGAIYVDDHAAPIIILESIFNGNRAGFRGGAIAAITDAPVVVDSCVFRNNSAFVFAGALLGPFNIRKSQFDENNCNDRGGAGFLWSSTVDQCLFTSNHAVQGGAIHGGGDTFVTNSLFLKNQADHGGAIYGRFGPIEILSSTIVENSALGNGGGIFLDSDASLATCSSIFWGNQDSSFVPADAQISMTAPGQAQVQFSCLEGWPDVANENGNTHQPPTFKDQAAGDFRLAFGSVGIDAGDFDCAAGALDLGNQQRVVNDPASADAGRGALPFIDMGAYEYQPIFLDLIVGQCPNTISARSPRRISAAILGGTVIPLEDIDVSSLRLFRRDGIGTAISPLKRNSKSFHRDAARPVESDLCDCTTGGDRVRDLVIHFSMAELQKAFELEDVPIGTSLQVVLRGSLLSGEEIAAADCLVIQKR